ncbi:MAG: DUF2141 domain-containing protein [Sphingobacteriaceae bacterium]|nr:DUF2141 domain-containing protein [Cytophagaceae bacterium]
MKTLLIAVILFSASVASTIASPVLSVPPCCAAAADSGTYKLTALITTVTKRSGMLYVGVANTDATFDGDSYRKTRIEIPATGEVQVSFDGLPVGRYAIRVYQDLNDNQKLDFNGPMPTEPFGFSNVKTMMGPPSFAKCAFDLNASKTVVVGLLGL